MSHSKIEYLRIKNEALSNLKIIDDILNQAKEELTPKLSQDSLKYLTSQRRDLLNALETKDAANLTKIIKEIDDEMDKLGQELKEQILGSLPA